MKLSPIFLLCLTNLLIQSCASTVTQKGYTQSDQYQKRAEIKKDYLLPTNGHLSGDDINSLLEKKVNLKRPLKVAVVRLNHDNKSLSRYSSHEITASQRNLVTSKNAKYFSSIVKRSKYIKDISLIPQFIMPKEKNFKRLRDVGALMQSDLLLILNTKSLTDYQHNLTQENEAKSIATIEAIVLDVKTGVIPFTSVSTAHHLAKKGKTDFSNKELQLRATIAAEDKALKELSEGMIHFFN